MRVAVHQSLQGNVIRVEDMTPEEAAEEIQQRFHFGAGYTVDDLIRTGYASTPLKDWNLLKDDGSPVGAVSSWLDYK